MDFRSSSPQGRLIEVVGLRFREPGISVNSYKRGGNWSGKYEIAG